MNDNADDTTDARGGPERLDGDALFRRLKGWYRIDREASSAWRQGAREDFEFAAGHQWDHADLEYLREQGRPPITFNRVLPVIKAVAGSEVNNRQDIQFLPRQVGASGLNEVLTEASRYLAQESEAEEEESDAFCDLAICGMGWVEMRLDYEIDPDGAYVEDRVDPFQMVWDSSATKRNIVDARRLFRAKSMDMEEARALFPDVDPSELDAAWAEDRDSDEPHRNPLPHDRRKGENPFGAEDEGCRVTIVEAQWWERERAVRVLDPATGRTEDLSEADFAKASERLKALGMPEFPSMRITRRRYRRAFLGSTVLEPPADSPAGDRFSYGCMTGDRDHTKGQWFGIVRAMKDPQRYANKWLSQTLDMLNRQSKGGVMMEKGAVDNAAEFEKTWSKPGGTSWVKDGALTGGRIKEKALPQLPTGHYQLMEFALLSIRDTSGVNLEMLGQQTQEQAGVLEVQRKKAALTILATLFDALRRLRKHIGRVRLHLIQNFLSDGRLIRITGSEGQQVIPLVRDKVAGQYDVIIDDAPTSTNQKEIIWATFTAVLPLMKEFITPDVIAEILPYSPFPDSFVRKIQAMIAQGPAKSPEAEEQRQLAVRQVIAKISDTEASAELKRSQAGKQGADRTKTEFDIAKEATLLGIPPVGELPAPISSPVGGVPDLRGPAGPAPAPGALPAPPNPVQPPIGLLPGMGMAA